MITVCSGAYVGTYNRRECGNIPTISLTNVIGVTRNGYQLSWVVHGTMWNKSTTFSRSIIEGIYEGADWTIRFHVVEWLSQSSKEFAWPWGVPAEANRGLGIPDSLFQISMGRVGRRFTNWAGMLLLTSTAGTPAASSPATFTSPFCIMKANEQSGFSLDSTNREIPCTGIMLPFKSSLSNVDCGGMLSSTAATLWFRTT